MQSINLVRYINYSLSPDIIPRNQATKHNNNSISRLLNNNSLQACDFCIVNGTLEQNFNCIKYRFADIELVKNIILSNNTNAGILAALPCFLIQIMQNTGDKFINLTVRISEILENLKLSQKENNKQISFTKKIKGRILGFIMMLLITLFFNFIFIILYLLQVLRVIIFVIFNFMISLFYIL